MRNVTLEEIFIDPITRKYLQRCGVEHSISVAEYAFSYAKELNKDHLHVDPFMAAKAGLLHDIGHYKWYRDGHWDFKRYKRNDIHPLKGANRAHKILIRLGENRHIAKEIALAVLFHTDSYLPGPLRRSPLQHVVSLADETDKEPAGHHHYRNINQNAALVRIRKLDDRIKKHNLNIDKKTSKAPTCQGTKPTGN